jgi:hypothetical protein
MRILRLLTLAIAAIGILAPSQAFAQDDPTPPPAPTVNVLSPAPSFLSSAPNFAIKSSTPPRRRGGDAQGLGIFLQGGYVNSQVRSGDEIFPTTAFDMGFNGFMFGIAFGGNKSGWVGFGFDLNYIVKNAGNMWFLSEELETSEIGELVQHYLQLAGYARINFFGHDDKEAATLYAIVGGFVDILLKGEINGIDIKDQFNGFQAGPTFGVGFEWFRIGVEVRFDWSLTELNETGGGTFLNGLEGTKDFKTMVIFRVRLH